MYMLVITFLYKVKVLYVFTEFFVATGNNVKRLNSKSFPCLWLYKKYMYKNEPIQILIFLRDLLYKNGLMRSKNAKNLKWKLIKSKFPTVNYSI